MFDGNLVWRTFFLSCHLKLQTKYEAWLATIKANLKVKQFKTCFLSKIACQVVHFLIMAGFAAFSTSSTLAPAIKC